MADIVVVSQTVGTAGQEHNHDLLDNKDSNKGGTAMIDYKNNSQKHTQPCLSAEESNKRRKRRWKRRIKIRAAIIKKQLQIENRFHKAMREMRTTTDQRRRSYLHWILHQMFSLFDYETGLHAINDKAAYQSWLSANEHNNKL
ncbi:MAG: hypothetical protein QNL62_19825 [Gammaproteobacteria bacterium]|nr:hypothetical protein [Gammaproteobacteria bacterium]